MKENNRNPKYTHKKNIVLSKKEIKIVNHILDFKKINKPFLPINPKKNQLNKKSFPNKLEPIKVRLTPINKRYNSKGKKNLFIKEPNFNLTNSNKFNNSLYLSPTHSNNKEKSNFSKIKIDKKINYTENRNEIKEDKINRNCSTPYRKILHDNKQSEGFSPSTSVIIKNFNYNNVYNINIDNDKIQGKKNNKFYNNTLTKKDNENNNLNNTKDNESLSKLSSCKEEIAKKVTYHKPKTSSTMNTPCILSKRNKSRDISLINDDKKEQNNNSFNKNATVFSRFITEGNNLKNCRNNEYLPISSLISNATKLDNKKHNETPNRTKSSTNFNNNIKKSSLNDYNLAVKTINNNTYNNHFLNNDSYSSLNFNKTGKNNFHNVSNLSLSKTYINNRKIINSPTVFSKCNNKFGKNKINENKIINNEIKNININLNDLFIFEDRINDIVSAFNKTNNIYDTEASNECNEFISFYAKSSLKGIFSTFFKENNKLIIESSINLSLFFISIVYNLSTNNYLYNDIITTINKILLSLKINFALYIKKLQVFYGTDLIKKNYKYFQPFNNFLSNINIKDIEEEDDITYKIYQNCRSMTNEIKIIMKYYQKINVNYYNYFIKIFNNISIQKEEDLLNYFFSNKINYINKINNSSNLITVNKNNYNNSIKDLNNIPQPHLKKNKTNIDLASFSPYKKEKLQFKTPEKIYLKSPMRTIKNEKRNKIEIPYIQAKTDKKYTLVLDLNKTLAYCNKDNEPTFRNGLFSFLSMIKPYYELISFSCEPNDITEKIIKEIESQKKYFDYNFTREYSILYENTLVKDISLIGRDISKIIIVDDDENCFKLNKENGIKIRPFEGENKIDNVLFELKKILILIHKKDFDDVRIAIKEFSNDIKNKISLE